MGTDTGSANIGLDRPSLVGVAGVVGLVGLTGLVLAGAPWKVLVISWVAFAAMAGAAALGARTDGEDAVGLVWGYGLASGAMVTSAAVFLVPQAIGFDSAVGGFGVAAGLLGGYSGHTVGHRLSHREAFDSAPAQLAAHSLSAGAIIGLVYAALPGLGLLLGLSIVSHKGPAGYAAARRLRGADEPVSVLLLPSAGVGLTAIPTALLQPPSTPAVNAAIFGFAAGVFLHVAMDFLPECEVGGEVTEAAGVDADAHALLDRMRVHAVASTVAGALAVFGAWLVVA
ncbi:ZIP family metal transporter [Natronomonas marina]|jgi:ZIP family zinc transporter|uniref:ZIP family metal transporter n=1 Tax=Natronomonas marina TaxID=2961939 RepID=UPI0020C9FBE2|nr:ZIP family metal transporter [Natronomonas marina]